MQLEGRINNQILGVKRLSKLVSNFTSTQVDEAD